MKDFFSKHGIWILLIAVIVSVSMAALSTFGTGVATPIKNVVGMLVSPVEHAMSSAGEWIDDRIRFASEFDALKEENEALRDKIARLEQENRQAQADSAENRRLRELLNLRPQQRDFKYEIAKVTNHTNSNWTRTLTLNRGSSTDVAVKDCVIDSRGNLVGVVSEVGTNWCTVLTTVDTDFEMGAIVFRSGDAAIASGSFNLMADNLLTLNYISAEGALLNGDLIISSGLGGYYPSNLVIGSVQDVIIDDSGAMDYAMLAPAVDFDALTDVFIITDFTIVE